MAVFLGILADKRISHIGSEISSSRYNNHLSADFVPNICKKRDFIIEKQIVRHFLQYSECLLSCSSLL